MRFLQALLGSLVLPLFFATVSQAAQVRVTWSPNGDPEIRGYKVWVGTAPDSFPRVFDVGNTFSHIVSGLSTGKKYYVAVSAINRYGIEGKASSPVSVTVPNDNDYDGDGVLNTVDTDDDSDSIGDAEEMARGTNPYSTDSDRDGVSDRQEIANGTNPADAGSGEAPLDQRVCSEWNGFLGGMWNIAEVVNVSGRPLSANVTLYDQLGLAMSERNYEIPSGQQLDSLIHDFPGRVANSYGNVCITHNGAPGDLDGRMVYYKESRKPKKGGGEFDFALAMPFTNGKRGNQFVLFDTFQRSGARADANNFVANWIQISNLGFEQAEGVLRTYNVHGAIIGDQPIALQARQRLDLPAHQFGGSQIGLVEWIPTSQEIPFTVRNIRYIYDNAGHEESFTTAFQQEGVFASGDDLVIPFDTTGSKGSVLHVSNALGTTLHAWINFFDTEGQPAAAPQLVTIMPKASFAVPLESIVKGNRGSVLIRTGAVSSIVAGLTEITRTKKNGISNMSLITAKSGSGTVLLGSFNTYMEQRADVWITNATDFAQETAITAVPSSGAGAHTEMSFVIPSHGTRLITLPGGGAYGVVTVQNANPNALVAWVKRQRTDFVLPTPMRE